MKNNWRIFVDMDEVLTDFVQASADIWNVSRIDLENEWELGKWDIVPPLARFLRRSMTQEQFWEPIHNNEPFWSQMIPTPFAGQVLDTVNLVNRDWHIITSPNQCVTSYNGKVAWLKRNYGRRFDRFCITPHKYLFATPNSILIDDRDSNVTGFIKAGGRGIVFPRHHNSQHQYKNDPVKYLTQRLEELGCI